LFVTGKPFQPTLMLTSRARANPSEEPFRSSKVRLFTVQTNIKLGWKDLPGLKTLAFKAFIIKDLLTDQYYKRLVPMKPS
jgi:hypothetical protein